MSELRLSKVVKAIFIEEKEFKENTHRAIAFGEVDIRVGVTAI